MTEKLEKNLFEKNYHFVEKKLVNYNTKASMEEFKATEEGSNPAQRT
jgi:hypothetical protein